jgi:hypothetical protein
MKKHFINALVAVSLLATLNSCSKDQGVEADSKPVKASSHPLDPGGFGYIDRGEGELYYYEDSMTTYSQAGKNYLIMKPLSLEKYKNGQLLDSVCNKDLAVYFPSKVLKTHDTSTPWGLKKTVASEYASIVTITSGVTTIIKLSKLVSAFGFEFNSPYKDKITNMTIQFWNSKTNQKLRNEGTFRINNDTRFGPVLGTQGGALLEGVESGSPFNEIRITFSVGPQPAVDPPYNISFGGFRYKLAK